MSIVSTLHRADADQTGTMMPIADARQAVSRALDTGTAPLGLPAALLREHGTLKLYLYQPRGTDHQPVHDQDEVYVVISGSGQFAIGDSEATLERFSFGPGTAIFTPAGTVHRFEDFTDDFETWVIMYGPDGGEASVQSANRHVSSKTSKETDGLPFAALKRLARDRRRRAGTPMPSGAPDL